MSFFPNDLSNAVMVLFIIVSANTQTHMHTPTKPTILPQFAWHGGIYISMVYSESLLKGQCLPQTPWVLKLSVYHKKWIF